MFFWGKFALIYGEKIIPLQIEQMVFIEKYKKLATF
jgi:hypothetical protein